MRGGKRTFNQEKAAETVHTALDQASSLAQSIIEQAAARALEGAQKARETGSSVSSRASDRLDSANKTIERDVAPSVKDVALQAATVALELWQTARDKAELAIDLAESAIEIGKNEVPAVASHAMDAAEKRVEAAGHALEAAEKRVEDAGEKARSASKHAASATAGAGKETGSALLWAGAAAGLILFGVLQKERRDQVLRYAESALSLARDLIGDYKGHDGSFDATSA